MTRDWLPPLVGDDDDWPLAAALESVLTPGARALVVGDGAASAVLESFAGVARHPLDPACIVAGARLPDARPALVSIGAGGDEADVLAALTDVLLRWRPLLVVDADPEAAHSVGRTLADALRPLRRCGYVVRALARTGLRKADSSVFARPGCWFAVPCERKELVSQVTNAVLRWGLLPPFARSA